MIVVAVFFSIVYFVSLNFIAGHINKYWATSESVRQKYIVVTIAPPIVLSFAMSYEVYEGDKSGLSFIDENTLLFFSLFGIITNAGVYGFEFLRAKIEWGAELPSGLGAFWPFVFHGISFIAAVLGIIGFYLQFLS